MKRILFISLLFITFLVSPKLFASTTVGASLSENAQWDQSGSPYIVQNRVLVPPGVTLKIGPGVQVVFQGPATLHVTGQLIVEGSAAAPAVFNMTDAGLQSALFIDGGEAQLSNAKVLSGVFLALDATIRMDGCEVTKGSGLYLKGNSTAHLKNNKFYGNATGVVLDGAVAADMQFNTLVQNTYGLYLKNFSKLTFLNNSVHDNDSEVVNNGSKAKLGRNYWGTMSPQTVRDKIKGEVALSPMRDIKDILRAYLRSELPVITKAMSDQAEKEDLREEKAAKEALKEFKKKQQESSISTIATNNQTMTPIVVAVTPTNTFTPVVVPATVPASDLMVPPPALEAAPPAVSVPPASVSTSSDDFGANIPMPPSSDSNAPEPPALGDLAASAVTSAPTPMPNTPTPMPTDTPVPQDTGMDLLPPPADLTSSVSSTSSSTSASSQEPAMDNLSTSQGTPTPQATSGDLASIVATAQAGAQNSTPTVIPTVALPDLGSDLTSPEVPVVSDTPTSIPMQIATATSTPVVVISTPTPMISNAAPAVSAASGSLVPIAPNTAPPPPDLGDNSNLTAQPSMPNANTAPALPASSSDQSAKPASPPPDVDGMQAPPMDSGLDFAVPKN